MMSTKKIYLVCSVKIVQAMAMNTELEKALLYGIVDRGYVDENDIESVTHDLISGGADVIQLRAKGCGEGEILEMARQIVLICREAQVPFVVNDFPEIAKQVKADGVHVGQDDGSLLEVRSIVGEEMIVGRSTHSVAQAEQALLDGFDYIGFGPLFATPTKKGRPGIGMENVSLVQDRVGSEIPVFCIGGITRKNIETVAQAGAKRVVIVSDLLAAESIEQATASAKNIITKF
ncbi:MAG: thiamine-phosphate pyrophosphorylase [Cryomorphaceae bacterium]|jgi:thiamine-phosphate pyrophosphorylase